MSTIHDLKAKFSTNTSEPNAALRGALSAFPGARPLGNAARQQPTTNHGAAAAASIAERRKARPLDGRRQIETNASYAAVRAHTRSQESLLYSGLDASKLSPQSAAMTSQPGSARATSPSNVAAALAAARSGSNNKASPKAPSLRLIRPVPRDTATPSMTDSPVEEMPVKGTVGDVRRWLQSLGDGNEVEELSKALNDTAAADAGALHTNDNDQPPAVLSPKPVRIASASTSLQDSTFRDGMDGRSYRNDHVKRKTYGAQTPSLQKNELDHAHLDSAIPAFSRSMAKTFDIGGSSGSEKAAIAGISMMKPPPPPPARRSRPPVQPRQDSESTVKGAVASASNGVFKAPPLTLDLSASSLTQVRDPVINDESSLQPPKRSQTTPLSRPTSQDFSIRRITPHMTGDSLANAIVASSLASSRAPSPTKRPAPVNVSKGLDKPRIPFRHFKEHESDSRTPSPAKTSRYSMRKQPLSDDGAVSTHHRKNKFFRKHPHKHHEGDRKRWRDTISEMERKRYEGVWAANKNIFITTAESNSLASPGFQQARDDLDCVCNLIVRDIWKRSKLPFYILAEVWELVDRTGSGSLDRQEFVVGMWLIDQRLKGRKLPIKVSESVWGSVRGVQGVRVPLIR